MARSYIRKAHPFNLNKSGVKWGAGNHTDPSWLLENTSLNQIEAMLAAVLPAAEEILRRCKDVRVRRIKAFLPHLPLLLNLEEAELVFWMDEQYNTRTLNGHYDRPLNGLHLYYLHSFYQKVCADTALALANI